MNSEFKRMMKLAGLTEIKVNKPNSRKLKVDVSDSPDRTYYSFKINNEDSLSLFSTDFSKEYVSVYLNEDDIYADRMHEEVVNYLNQNEIPFIIQDLENDTTISSKEFEISEDPDDFLDYEILINKKDCIIPQEYQEKFNNL